MTVRLVTLLVLSYITTTVALAQSNWPQFRGIDAGVVADDPALPDRWSSDENVAWQIDIPGRAWSSPIVWGDHVFVLTVVPTDPNNQVLQPVQPVETYRARSLGGTMTRADIVQPVNELEWVLYDIEFDTGETRWSKTLHATVPSLPTHQKSTYASETPITDGERVYVYLADIGLFAFDFNGSHLDFDLTTNVILESFNFRYSLTPVVSLVIDFRTWLLGGGTIDLPAVDLGSSFFGIGIRVNGKYKRVKPFLQVSTYLVTENVDFESGISENGNIFSEDGIGIGLSTGLDIKVSELISIPVEIIYIGTDGDDIDNLSGYGLSAGVSFNF